MSEGLAALREQMAAYLNERGARAITAWPGEERGRWEEPVTVVSLRSCQLGPASFQNYLGERYDQETGLWQELYGRRAQVTFGLDLYAPEEGDGAALQQALDTLTQALAQGGPSGLAVQEVSCGETAYDTRQRLVKKTVQAVCQAYFRTAGQSGELFADFEVRGGLTV